MKPFGTFKPLENSQGLICPVGVGKAGQSANALTHSNDTEKLEASGSWSPPPKWSGKIRFYVTVAVERSLYWVALKGQFFGLNDKCLFCYTVRFKRFN